MKESYGPFEVKMFIIAVEFYITARCDNMDIFCLIHLKLASLWALLVELYLPA